jgi:hypothetical protein
VSKLEVQGAYTVAVFPDGRNFLPTGKEDFNLNAAIFSIDQRVSIFEWRNRIYIR